jgi:AcrR family transcriptional regulator
MAELTRIERKGTGVQSDGPVSGIESRRRAARKDPGPAFAARRAAILRAAGEVFHEQGVERTSLNDVGVRAGMDRASVYYYFASKEELFKEIVYDVVVENVRQAEAIAFGDDRPARKLRKVITALITSFAEHDPYLAIYVEEYLPGHSKTQAKYPGMEEIRREGKRYEQAVIRIVHEGIESGDLRPVADEKLLAYMIIGMMNSSARWLRQPTRKTAMTAANAMAEVIVSGLGAQGRVPFGAEEQVDEAADIPSI